MRPSDHNEPKKIAWLQCVGSRDINKCDHSYCSAVCCMYAIKESVIAKEHAKYPLDAAIFFMDMRTYGKEFEKYYRRAEDEGVRFIRSRIHSIEPADNDNLRIAVCDRRRRRSKKKSSTWWCSPSACPRARAFSIWPTSLGIELNDHDFAATSELRPGEHQPGRHFRLRRFPGTQGYSAVGHGSFRARPAWPPRIWLRLAAP